MSKYLGQKCMVCKLKFNENDDIVVCPECGTPHHRECYIKTGECVNKTLHETGESWKREYGTDNDKSGYKKCSYCDALNKPHSIICENCGSSLIENLQKNMSASDTAGKTDYKPNNGVYGRFTFDPNDKCCGMNPDEEFESVKLCELADFVKSNQLYYLPIFKKIKDSGQKISLNIMSFLFPELYFANRKMWLWTAVSIIICTLLSLPSFMYILAGEGIIGVKFGRINIDSNGFEIICNISSWIIYAFKALMLLFANWLYYRHALNKINHKKLSKEKLSKNELSATGGTSLAGAFISFAIKTFLTLLAMYFFIK